MSKISQDIIDQIPILFKELGTRKAVAEKLGISASTVSKYLNLSEAAAASPEKKTRVKITPEVIEQINKLYAEKKNMAEVARNIGISIATVKKYLTPENLELCKKQYDDRDALYFYVYRLFGQYSEEYPVDPWNILQMQKFAKQGMSYRGQLLALKYFYEVKRNPVQERFKTIAIISYIYSDAERYYTSQASRAEEIARAIQLQLEKDRIEIKINPSDYFKQKKKKKTIDLNKLGDD